ncbi:hypothetical protein IMSHALPRED_005697 [Imshaugia aleurites]|uniref:PH domain-containing protein n=1 Tax=Imshaugia aleurites TaxID=172621 RepID=A0A8H3FDR5_9LECA|nr:hypothetical protein IMSHALPRED_005697 [Imshaugia aleurites]
MPPPSSPDQPSLPVEGTIARSRSRYKGPRQHKTLTNPSKPPSLSAEQLERMGSVTLAPCGSRQQNDGEHGRASKLQPPLHESLQKHRWSAKDVQRPEPFVAENRGKLTEADNRTTFRAEVNSQSQAPQAPQAPRRDQQDRPRERYEAEAEPHKDAGQDVAWSQEEEICPEQYSRNPGPELHSLHKEGAAATIRSPALPTSGLTQRIAGHSNGKRLQKIGREELKRTISGPIALEPPQNTAKPAFDAPVSAVNAGERRVKVRHDQNTILLPVTPSTTPWDIIRSAADQLAESLDPNSTVLVESFKQLGLERPLRTYEHVRDVLNSWDNDMQNTLVITPSPTGSESDMLDLCSVSRSQPGDVSVYIQYSQRPGHWDKRWVTLRSDGQMLVAKREGGETSNICHISDFDIYIPTARQSAKRIRPPRKICFAVKSQQKSSMFLSTANFVHFFSTSDKALAASWYKAIQDWRSWYLVNVMGEGEGGAQSSRNVSTKADIQQLSDTRFSKPESQRISPEPPSPSMKSIKASTLTKYNTARMVPVGNPNSMHFVAGGSLDDIPFRSRSKTQQPQSKKPTKDVDAREHGVSFVQAGQQAEPEPFAATGLLGRTYTQRQKAHREREKAREAGPDQPVAPPDNNRISSLHRTLSQRPKPKPLIDLTPLYQEPAQHAKKGRGVILERIPAGGLVEVANTPETAAISVPSSTTWRRPTSSGRDGPSVGRSRTVRRDHSSGAPSEPHQIPRSPDKGGVAFTGGLLASDSRGQGGARTGRGVMTGNRQAKEPMLDVGEERRYAPGSLLERAERQDGGSYPIIEREKKREIIAAVGEGT